MMKYGMFYGGGSNKEIVIKKRSDEAPWIAQLKSTFNDVKDKVAPYATKRNAFNAMGEELEKFARMYFEGDEENGKYRVFGLGKNVGEKGSSAFSSDKIKSYKDKREKVFEYENCDKITPFIEIVKANGCATKEQIKEFKELRDFLLNELE